MIEVACMQLEPRRPGEPVSERVESVAGEVAELPDADLIVLPELWPSGYFCFDEYRDVAEPLGGPIATSMSEAARSAGAHLLAGSFVEHAENGELFNTAVLFGPDGDLLASYRKMHVFGFGSREVELISGGDTPCVTDTPLGRIGLATCYDLRFPELFRREVEAGAELFIVPAAWPAARAEHWRILLQARAIENLAAVVACNGAGTDGGTELAGHSAVIDPWGEVIAESGHEPAVLRARLDAGSARQVRAGFPILRDRR